MKSSNFKFGRGRSVQIRVGTKRPKKFTRKRMSTKLKEPHKNYFSKRRTTNATKNIKLGRAVSKGCSQGSCLVLGMWNIFHNSLLKLKLTSKKIIATGVDILLLTSGELFSE